MTLSAYAKETLVFQNQAGKLFYQPAGYVRLAWAPERQPVEIIQALYEQVLALLKSTGARRILSDHGARAPLPVAAQEWLTTDWIPRAMSQANTHHCAIVEGADPMHRLSTQSVVSTAPAGFKFKRFDNFAAADAWLRSQALPA
ncbi:hypothetical protein FNT36_10985 [Hymenobacter setariae]|uniref:STAS/SEC14 domain-containing protein n=1 Tax=Hymenobacter setariae TaxID=2594794 RepID=A0A558BZI4_9BACT|nr:hypothetical protein [Hymenobacter setariae]TVT41936.1 hypothetical protein FNT36_10985 [Hymenobacter setariae]